jgi:DNA-nicking Smr family endonuclease
MSRRRRSDPPPPGHYRPFADLSLPEQPASPESSSPQEQTPPGDDDAALFQRSVEDVDPIAGPDRITPSSEPRKAPVPDEDGQWREFARELIRGQVRFNLRWSDEFVEGRTDAVSEETMERLRAGRFSWLDHLDLHGMIRVEARQAVDRFISQARIQGHRCVLIVHGRGKGSEGGTPVLKEKLVAWLTREGGPGAHVLAFCTARPCDGGFGAVYVLLRRDG